MPLPDFHEFDDRIEGLGAIGEFWRWAMSDLLGNRNRGILTEYLVAKLLGADLSHPRLEWDCYDLEYRGYRIEVKSSSTVQTWHTNPAQRSILSFGIAPHNCWDARTNTTIYEKKRHAHLYVFCIFPVNVEAAPVDVLNLEQWRFFVTTTQQMESHLAPNAMQIGIGKVRAICGEAITHTALKSCVDSLLSQNE